MAKLKISDEWWTSPTESDNGKLIIVTGRRDMENVIATKKYNDRIEITWKYLPESNGMPDYETSSLMEKITDALNTEFNRDPIAIMTGIYTGDGQRDWIFYCMNLNIFQKKFNTILEPFETIPITIYVENDPDWNEYLEMKDQSEILEGD